jgi:hypothetical protein
VNDTIAGVLKSISIFDLADQESNAGKPRSGPMAAHGLVSLTL